MPKEREIGEGDPAQMEVETKEEPTEWNGDFFAMDVPQGVRSTCGLRNLGNSCYLNSVVQSLANVPPLAAFLTSGWTSLASPGAGAPSSNSQRREFCEQLAQATQKMWSGECRDFPPRLLTRSVIETVPEFRMHGQQDAEEALNYALNNLHDELFVPVAKECHPARDALEQLEKERQQLDAQAQAKSAKSKSQLGSELDPAKEEAARKKREEENRISQAYEPYKRSIVSDTFQSLLAQRVTCANCECMSLTVQESFNLPLELPSKAQVKSIPSSSLSKALPNTKVSNLKSSSSTSSLDPGSPKITSSVRKDSSDVTTGAVNTQGNGTGGGSGIWASFSSLRGVFSLGSSHSLNLEDCLRSFFASETLKGEEQYYCESCKAKVDATKVHEIVHLPETLCLQLKRFNKNRGTWGLGSAKNSTPVRYPLEGLDLRSYCGTVCSARNADDHALYDLIGVVRHSGSEYSGHYIATCKSRISGKWFEFDDEFVRVISDLDQLQSSDAYLLFYAKRASALDIQKKSKALQTLQQNDPSGRRFHLSRAWALRFETMTNPGPIENSTCQCEHGAILPTAVIDICDRVVSVSATALSTLEQLYGSQAPKRMASLEVCETCKALYDKLQSRRDSEYRTIVELDKKHPNLWYIVPKPWVSKWISFVKNDCGPLGRGTFQGAAPPSKIDTESLFETQPNGVSTVKANLKLNVHYQAVNRAVFKYWEVTYGVQGPVIPRVQDNIYSAKADEGDSGTTAVPTIDS